MISAVAGHSLCVRGTEPPTAAIERTRVWSILLPAQRREVLTAENFVACMMSPPDELFRSRPLPVCCDATSSLQIPAMGQLDADLMRFVEADT